MNKYGSRKFIIAVLLILATLCIDYSLIYTIPVATLVGAVPALLGFTGIVFGAIAVMYPASNAFAASKWSNEDG